MPVLHYAELPPRAPLDRFVDCCWSIFVDPAGPGSPMHWVLPDGCLSFAVRFDVPRMQVSVRPPAAVPLLAPCTAGESIIGVRLRPAAHHAVDLGGATWWLNGRPSPRGFSEAHELLRQALDRSIRPEGENRVSGVLDLVRQSGGRITVRHLADRAGVGERQLERLCLDGVGLRPKLFARIVRLQLAVRCIADRRRQTLADVAAECGYSDQAHLGRDFLALGHLRPSQYQQMSESFQLSLVQRTAAMSDLF